jgi:protein-disulfide isomerase
MNLLKDRNALAILALLALCTAGAVFWLTRGAGDGGMLSANYSQREMEQVIRNYIINNPQVLLEAMDKLRSNQEKEAATKQKSAIAKNEKAIFASDADFVGGNAKGDVTIVEFFDYRCGFCKRVTPDIVKLLNEDKNIRLVLKEFPILGPASEIASRAAIAAIGQGKYWNFHLALLAEPELDEASVMAAAQKNGLDLERLKKDMASKSVSELIERNQQLAQTLGVDATPTFIIAGEPVSGAISIETMKKMIADARKAKG